MWKPFMEKHETEKPLGVDIRPTDEQLRERIRILDEFIAGCDSSGNVSIIKAERDALEMALGVRKGRILDTGKIQYQRTCAEQAMDIEYCIKWNRAIDTAGRVG